MNGEDSRQVSRMTDKERDHIIKLLSNGIEAAEVGEILQRAPSTVRLIKRTYDAVKAGDIETARRTSSSYISVFEWACKRNGVDPNQKPEPSAPGPGPSQKVPEDREAILDAILALTNKTDLRQEDLMKKLDQMAVIIQSCAAGMKDTINTNADIIHREQMKHSETLNGIKVNTKSRYGNQIR